MEEALDLSFDKLLMMMMMMMIISKTNCCERSVHVKGNIENTAYSFSERPKAATVLTGQMSVKSLS